jgi:hypothetical protein
MRRRLVIATVGCALTSAVAPLGASGTGKPGYSCPPGFNLGANTFDEYLALPRTQAAINDGLTTTEQVLAVLASLDKNGSGSVCVKLSHGAEVYSVPFGEYFYNVVDDNASVG